MKDKQTILQQLAARSVMPMQNEAAIEQFLASGEPITFFNWECPPRFLAQTADGRQFVNYDLDLDKIFRGELLDEYTELPRVVESHDQEKAILTWLGELGIPYRFVKLVADTNAWYLTPASLTILGENTVRARFAEFAAKITEAMADYPGDTEVALFTDLMASYRSSYDASYNEALGSLRLDPGKVVGQAVWEQQLERTRHHMGMQDGAMVREFAAKTIASYGAEGVVLAQLSKGSGLRQAIWLNNHEIDERTIVITNFLRQQRGESNLPMLFMRE